MLHKYYCSGYSNNFNLKFWSDTSDEEWTIPDIQYSLKDLIKKNEDKLNNSLDGFKQYLYLQKSENTKRYWKVIIGVWENEYLCNNDNYPLRIIRITTKNFNELVPDIHTGRFYEELPLSLIEDENIRMFY